jgi:hypothetical protein
MTDAARPDAPVTDEHHKLAESLHAAWHCSQCRLNGQAEIAQLLANALRDARLEIVEEVGLLLADYEIDTGQTYPGLFAKLSKLRSHQAGSMSKKRI